MKKSITLLLLFHLSVLISKAQIPNPALIGYWQNWNYINAPYIPLDSIDNRYNVIEIAFAVPTSTTDMTMLFSPAIGTQNELISKIQLQQSHGKKVLISIGGASTSVDLTDRKST